MKITISDTDIGPEYPSFVIAEMSGNHNQSLDRAIAIVEAASKAKAHAIKLQTYTADTMTLDIVQNGFSINDPKNLWHGKSLYEIYQKAYTPWDWHKKIFDRCHELGIICFSTPFDFTAVDFLEEMDVPAYKIASFEIVDIPLLQKIAQTGKPIIMSTGMATLAEIDEAVSAIREAGGSQVALLKCNSAYPSPPDEMNLRTISHLAEAFGVPAGLSDHTLGIAVPVAAVALGACIIEKHFTLSRKDPGPDSAFSLEPSEFKEMVNAVRVAEQALGKVHYGVSEREKESLVFRRSLFVVKDVKEGEEFTEKNVRSIRPGYGLRPKYLKDVLGKRAISSVKRGTPVTWEIIDG